MKRNTKKCSKCKRNISNSNFKRHVESCGKEKEKRIKEEWQLENGKYKCPFCEKEYSKKGISTHIWKNHTEEGIKFKPTKGKASWNKGLTKETDVRIKNYGETYSKRVKSGEIIPNWKGKTHKEESKDKISKAMINFLKENPNKVPYIINHSSKMSYPEKIFFDKLKEENIIGWEYRYRTGIYEYDFAFINKKLDVEIDGSTHNHSKVKKIDKRRDEWSKERGWTVIRFSAQEVKLNINKCISELKKYLT